MNAAVLKWVNWLGGTESLTSSLVCCEAWSFWFLSTTEFALDLSRLVVVDPLGSVSDPTGP